MKLIDYVRVARRRWLIIVVMTVLGAGLAAVYTSRIPTTYEATSRVYVTMATGTSVQDSYQGTLAAQQRITSYTDLVTSSAVAQRVINDLNLSMPASELQEKITASSPPATALIDISVKDGDQQQAQLLADKVVAQFRNLVDDLETTVRDAAPAARVAVVDTAVPEGPVGPHWVRIDVLGGLIGFALGCLIALIRDRKQISRRKPNHSVKVSPLPEVANVEVDSGDEDETNSLHIRLTKAHTNGGTHQ